VAPAKTFSTGHDRSAWRSYWSLLKHYRHNRDFAIRHYRIFQDVVAAFRRYGQNPLEGSRMLEIGCGQRFPLTLLFASTGGRAVGIDLDYVEARPSLRTLISAWRRNGPERAVKTLLRATLFDRSYYRALATELGRPLRFDSLELQPMDARRLTFPDASFDYVCSSDVFEHIDDVAKASLEMARVLKPGGVAYVGLNVFAGISGGHHFEWAEPDTHPSKTVPAWDHLRKNMFPSQAYLNRLRERDYLAILSRDFEVVQVEPLYQGESQLTEEILGELPDYTREELLRGGLTVILRKPPD
jgi:SAM-dependent methyltransferase